jgi:hypothetical protein
MKSSKNQQKPANPSASSRADNLTAQAHNQEEIEPVPAVVDAG